MRLLYDYHMDLETIQDVLKYIQRERENDAALVIQCFYRKYVRIKLAISVKEEMKKNNQETSEKYTRSLQNALQKKRHC